MTATSRADEGDLPAIRQGLADRATTLFERLFDKPTKVRAHKHLWGRHGSLVLYLRGRNGAHWYSYEAREGGDMLAAIQHAMRLDFVGALDWARGFLGLPTPDSTTPHREFDLWRERMARERRQQAEHPSRPTADYDAEQAAKAESAADLAAAAQPIAGSLAEVYLRQYRSIDADAWPDAIGFVDAATVKRCIGWSWWRRPGLVVRATDAAGNVTGVQLVALNDDGSAAKHWEHDGKLKLSYGTLSGSAMRLAGDDRALLLAEGPETALSCWWATGIETWANLGSIAGAPLASVPLDRLIVVCADDDARTAQSNKALRDAIRGWRREGRRVVLVKPHALTKRDKSDFNDALKAEGREAVRGRIMAAIEASPAKDVLPGVADARERATEMIGDAIDDLLNPDPFLQYGHETLHPDTAPFKALRLPTGIGKTEIAIRYAVAAAAKGAKIVYLVPTHKLGAELAARIEAEAQRQQVEVSVETWRGRNADRPGQPDIPMCSELEMIAKARAAKADADALCKRCPAAADCPYVAQRGRKAKIWIGAHDLIWHQMPRPLKRADLVIIDEGFATRGLKGIAGTPTLVTDADLATVPTIDRISVAARTAIEADLHLDLMPLRQKLIAALRDHPEGWLTRERLIAAGLTLADAVFARRFEWKGKADVDLKGKTWKGAKKVLDHAAERNRLVLRLAALWHAVAELLAEDGPAASGRAAVTENGELRLFGAEYIKAEWRRTPTLHIDATVDMDLLRLRVPHAELIGEIEAECPHMRVVQYPDRAFGKLALRNERSLFKVWDWCVAYASRAGGKWGIVLPLEAEVKILAAREIPDFIRIHHFGALRGLDDLRDVRGLIAIGRPMAGPGTVEQMAGALSGRAVEAVEDWYPAEVVQLHARDGAVASVEADRHPDPLAERVRASIAEGELLQTVGRARGLNRTADDPVEIVLLTNVPVPGLAVDELRQWEGPSIDDEIFARLGAVPESAGDAATAAGLTLRQVKDRRQRSDAFSYKRYLYGNASDLGTHLRFVSYQLSGPGRARQEVVYDPRRIPDCRAWLTEKLGPLAYYAEVEAEVAAEPPAATADPIVKPRTCTWLHLEGRDYVPCGHPTMPGRDLCPGHLVHRAQVNGWGVGYRLGPDYVPDFEPVANDDAPPRPLPPPVARFVSMV